ncbi:uncharacterized protein DSM5745_08178 [Aspergillus mulundensis]|uniref:Rhodopsin domain-containing protein n=1 Tax=Aspergillus mulundensis TaxID=1810919 RepID=A0A3D8R9E8_9EURO|nr:hypothetical protein DSM5745_08178 [Aspergillus mulundensis]RDW70667.1 hypothetical protein DSM5745_08178 [Aspergillus mulundensis]
MERTNPGHSSKNSNVTTCTYYVVSSIVAGAMTLCVALRLYVRFRITRSPWWDDANAVLSLVSNPRHGTIKHIITSAFISCWNLRAYTGLIWRSDYSRPCFRLGMAMALTKALGISDAAKPHLRNHRPNGQNFTKITLLLLYLRPFFIKTGLKVAIWIGLVFCNAYSFAHVFVYNLVDRGPLVAVTHSVSIVGAVSDVYILALPMYVVAQLHMRAAKKGRVAAVFLTGLLFHYTSDQTWSLLPIYIVRIVETGVGIICSCLPILPPLFKAKDDKQMRGQRLPVFPPRGPQKPLPVNGSLVSSEGGFHADIPISIGTLNEASSSS